jgi:3-oxoacyl-[acyl-carrier-protein] synthase III
MYRSKIKGLGFYVPDNVVTNDDLSQRMDTNDAWIQERTGIQERRHVIRGEDTTTSMGVKAALKFQKTLSILSSLLLLVPIITFQDLACWCNVIWD